MEILENLFSKFFRVVSADGTQFIVVDNPKVKLTKELIVINYIHLSIYKDGDVVSYNDTNKLYIWFTKNKLDGNRVFVPEGFLAFKKIRNKENVIGLVDKKNYQLFVVVKNGVLISQIVKKQNSSEQFIKMLKKKYGIEELYVLPSEDESFLIKQISFDDFVKFNRISFNKEKIIGDLVEFVKLPLISLFFVMSIGEFAYYHHLQSVISSKKEYLFKLKKDNMNIKKQFSYLDTEKSFWSTFRKSELSYPVGLDILDAIAKTLIKHNGQIRIFNKSGRNVDVWVASDSSSLLVKDLMKTGYFSNINIISVLQQKNVEVAQLTMILKSLYGR